MAAAGLPLEDRVAIVTGAARGIGRATALAMARGGAHVVAVDLDQGTVKPTAEAVAALGRKAIAMGVDVGDVSAIDTMTRQVMEVFGRIDILVNNAGVTRRAYIMDLTEDDWDRIMRVNGKGVFFCLQRVAREMIPRRSGVVVNIASVQAMVSQANVAAYTTSKTALLGLTQGTLAFDRRVLFVQWGRIDGRPSPQELSRPWAKLRSSITAAPATPIRWPRQLGRGPNLSALRFDCARSPKSLPTQRLIHGRDGANI